MIDFIKMETQDFWHEGIINNELLDFTGRYDLKTGETLTDKDEAIYNGMKFTLISGKYLWISGSIHKYWSNGNNYTDFTFQDLKYAIQDLCSKFNLNPHSLFIRNIEF